MRPTCRPLAAFWLALLAAHACATVRVTTDYDPDQDFAGYRNYAWLSDAPRTTGHPHLDSPMLHERVRKGIDRTLAAKGFVPSDEQPDFLVNYDLVVERRLAVHTTDDVYYGRYGYRVAVPETTIRDYDEGSLVIDVADARTKKVVWRSVGSGRLRGASGTQDPVALQERVFEVVDEVLADFPPQRE